MRPSFQTQFNKITESYIANDLNLFHPDFCVCGVLHGGKGWERIDKPLEDSPYTYEEYGRIEKALFSTFSVIWRKNGCVEYLTNESPKDLLDFEENLFKGMVAALEVLKQIHIEGGEDVDAVPVLKQRSVQFNPLDYEQMR